MHDRGADLVGVELHAFDGRGRYRLLSRQFCNHKIEMIAVEGARKTCEEILLPLRARESGGQSRLGPVPFGPVGSLPDVKDGRHDPGAYSYQDLIRIYLIF